MFAFKRRSDGFEWHRYVRTTIKVRREDRKRRVDEARQAAVSGLKQAGRAGATAGAGFAANLFDMLMGALALSWHVIKQVPGVLARFLAPVMRQVGYLLGYLWDRLDLFAGQRPVQQGAMASVVLGGTWAAARLVGASGQPPKDALVALCAVVAGIVLIAVPHLTTHAPPMARALGRLMPRRGVPGWLPAVGGAGALLVAAGAVGWFAWVPLHQAVRGAAGMVGLGGVEVRGRAAAAGPDAVRINGQTVRLAGLETALPEQTCGDRGRRCTALAETALQEIVRGGVAVCAVDGDQGGAKSGTCRIGETDIAGAMVRRGAAFAAQGLFAKYGTEEAAARTANAGLWRGGNVERPSAFKARLTEAAQKAAPNGCAIKGVLVGAERRYLQPWEGEYARARVRTTRGERWFCNLQEAEAAGFKGSGRS